VGEREDRGEIDELSAMRHPRRNEVFRDVGSQQHSPEDEDFIELITAPFPPSGALLLCTDGLSDLVDSTQILSIIERYAKDPQLAARALIDAANEAGGKDNVTVIVVHGRDFASSTRSHFPTVEMPLSRVVVPQRRPAYLVAGVSLLAGLLLAGLLVAALKPHWRDTGSGTIFGWGAVREPRIWRVQSDINTAMRQARPGDTVLVAPGSYFEQLQLREGVAVVSEAPGQAVLDGQGVAVTADGVRGARIEGFRIIAGQRQPLTVGIQVTDSDVQVVDVEITGAQTSGIEILGNSSGTFRANNVSGNPGTGVVIRDYAKPRLVHNTIANNGRGAGSPRPGVEVSGSAQPVLQANIFSNNAAEAIWATQLNVEALLRQNFSLSEERPRTRPRVRPAK
jgi:parallel beta-helix repeat protein